MHPRGLEEKHYPTQRAVSARKLEGNRQNGSKSAGAEDANHGDPKEPVTLTGGCENTASNKEPTTTESQIATIPNPESVATRRESPPRSDDRPPKFALENGELAVGGDSCPLTALHQALGTPDEDLIKSLLEQATNALTKKVSNDPRQYNHILAALHGIGPRDPLEGLLAVQMVAVHNQAMEFLRRAAQRQQSTPGADLNVNSATKLLRTFLAQMEALSSHRGKGDRRMVVEHLHVHKGAQAIVGPVSHQGPGDAAAEDHGQSEQ